MRAAGHTHVKFLRDATLEQLAKCVSLDAVTLRRARHGISEDQRTLRAKEALKAADYPQVRTGSRDCAVHWQPCCGLAALCDCPGRFSQAFSVASLPTRPPTRALPRSVG